eukprot:NODE_1128_length_490_cov_87.440771_g1118_i0.p2 GENE.NODE_1128_length_490_cov_87.440771_g1118_i0~~NODE_1128_length_490_cov_87.440771_g1118_i0.p2  ORF type:complete len:100 (+),score=36.07 NODE_1128_length_490_cov_87.440771_g1118_i0:47-301(+)
MDENDKQQCRGEWQQMQSSANGAQDRGLGSKLLSLGAGYGTYKVLRGFLGKQGHSVGSKPPWHPGLVAGAGGIAVGGLVNNFLR